jgi:hypothetical protein
MFAAAQDSDALVSDVISVADRTIADQARCEGSVMQALRHVGSAIDHTRREQHGAGLECLPRRRDGESVIDLSNVVLRSLKEGGATKRRLGPHPRE